jgi:PAS domain S-box-containing protein
MSCIFRAQKVWKATDLMAPANILLISDNVTTIDGLRRVLAEHVPGGKLTSAVSETACDVAMACTPQCVVIDLAGAIDDAVDLLRRMKSSDLAGTFVLLLLPQETAPEAGAAVLYAGADDVLQHPVNEVELVARIRVMLRMKEADDQLRAVNDRLASLLAERGRALQQTEERYRLLFNNVSDAVFIIEIDSDFKPIRILEVNDVACQKSGYSREELLDLSIEKLLAPERIEAIPVRLESIVKHKQVIYDTVYMTKDGREWPVEVHARVVELDKRPTVLGIARDLREREEAQLDLSERDTRYRILTDQTRQMIYDYLIKENRIRWIGAVSRVTGYAPHELEDCGLDRLLEMVHPDDVESLKDAMDQAIKYGGSYHVEYRLQHHSGAWCHIEDEGLTLPGEDGKAYRILGTAKDITSRVLEEEERRKLEQQMQAGQKLESLGVLAGGIAHDFNNILVAIIGLTDMAMRDIPMDSPAYEDLDEALQAAHRAKELVKQILAFSRQDGEERAVFYLHVVVREVVKLARATLPSNVRIVERINLESGLVTANVIQMHQILMNYFTNASYAMQPRGGTLEVSLEDVDVDAALAATHPRLLTGSYVRLSVRDGGHGMKPEVLKRIFDPFFTTKGPGEGTGMGLSVVHGIVTSHGGAIVVESTPGHGSTFHTYLPRADKSQLEEPRPEEGTEGTRAHVLFVDDEEMVTRFGESALKRMGFTVEVANHPLDALDIFQKKPEAFDIVVTDQVMPSMMGSDLAMRIKAVRPDVPVVLFTGFSDRIVEADARRAGIQDVLYKPLIGEQLAKAVMAALRESKGNP